MIFEIEIVLRVLLAGVLGGLIGYERERKQRPAGFRTHILVCIGAALVMIVSEHMLVEFGASRLDPTRLGAQVISGIGFLGAGTIIRDKFRVKGLTTAASLWAVACVGLAVGMGYFYIALVTALIIIITLTLLGRIEHRSSKSELRATIKIVALLEEDIEGKIINNLKEYGYDVKKMNFNKNTSDGTVSFNFLVGNVNTVEWEDISLCLFNKDYIIKASLDY